MIKKKTCTKCKNDFSIDGFPTINKKTNKKSSLCANCKREYDREWWAKHKHLKLEEKRVRSKRRHKSLRLYIVNFLKKTKCILCEISDWRVLEFHHRDQNEKKFNLANGPSYSLREIKIEIAKCDVVCANCHKIITMNQFGYYDGLV